MTENNRVVIVGASVAGVRCATAMRSAGFAGTITLLDAEDATPYDKPQLSKRLGASASLDHLITDDALRDHGIEFRRGAAATGLDLEARRVVINDDEAIEFDELVIATGCSARRWPTPLPARAGYVRTRSDWDRLHAAVRAGGQLLVVGGGFLGLEAAAAARTEGMAATVVDVADRILARGIPRRAADFIADRHTTEGIELRLNLVDPTLTGDDNSVSVAGIAGDYAVVSVGAVPNTAWLNGSGLTIENGVVCDATLAAAPGVWVIGDCARWENARYGALERHEHWTTAGRHAQHVATSIATGVASACGEVSYVWSDQFDWKIQSVGRHGPEESHYTAPNGAQVFLSGSEGTVTGVATINAPGHSVKARQLLRSDDPTIADVVSALGLGSFTRAA